LLDRRAGRIPSERSAELVELLDRVEVPGHEVSVHAVRGHRFVVVFHGVGSRLEASDTDPGVAGDMPLESRPASESSDALAQAVNDFVAGANDALEGKEAQAVALRGISSPPELPSFADRFALRPAAIAAYPMYRGLARLAGMEVLDTGDQFGDELATLRTAFAAGNHDFYFLHYKPADAAGEDGDFAAKVAALEELDGMLGQVLDLEPDVLVVAGDHATPAVFGGHSWHPVPLAIRSRLTKGDGAKEFSERAFAAGSIGTVPATSVMTLAMAHAGRLKKFGP
jgi:2,3-bisphosphoglycerate-independent phosphoglycerate mutase